MLFQTKIIKVVLFGVNMESYKQLNSKVYIEFKLGRMIFLITLCS